MGQEQAGGLPAHSPPLIPLPPPRHGCPAGTWGCGGLCPPSATLHPLFWGAPQRCFRAWGVCTPRGGGVVAAVPCYPQTPFLGQLVPASTGASRDPQNRAESRAPPAPPPSPRVGDAVGQRAPPEALTRPWRAGPSPPAPGSAGRCFWPCRRTGGASTSGSGGGCAGCPGLPAPAAPAPSSSSSSSTASRCCFFLFPLLGCFSRRFAPHLRRSAGAQLGGAGFVPTRPAGH